VRAAGRQGERPARGHAQQAALGIQLVEQREEVVLAGRATVEEDECALSLARRRSESVD
jgi:hypothetical protein